MNDPIRSSQEAPREIWLAASFHLPFPLGYLSDRRLANWQQVSERVVTLFLQSEKAFKVLPSPTDEYVNFPGGDPVGVQYDMFWETIGLEGRLRTSGLIPANGSLSLNHQIWICPSGAVLLVGRLTLDATGQKMTVGELDEIVQSIYADFAKVFLEVVQALMPLCREVVTSGVMCFRKDQTQIVDFVMRAPSTLDGETDGQSPDCESQDALAELLEDVYYLDFVPEANNQMLRIGYFSSEVRCRSASREAYGMAVLTAFAAFREMLWMHESLVAFTDRMQTGLCDLRRPPSDAVASIRLVRLACLRFIDESRPMRIRLTREFMECVERCWTEFRMHDLVQQIRDQLATLVETGEWFESIRREIRNFRIGAVGVVFTALSFLSVAIALVDLVYPTPTDYGRIAYVLAGGAGGALLTVAILISPASFWHWVLRFSLPRKRRRPPSQAA